VGSIR